MKLSKYTLLYILLVGIVILTGCSDHLFDDEKQPDSNRILLSGDIEQLAVTRVNDNGFCDGDKMGVYIVDYEGDYPGTLKVSGTVPTMYSTPSMNPRTSGILPTTSTGKTSIPT